MKNLKTEVRPTPWQNTHAALLLACAIVFLAVFFILAGPSWDLALFRLVLETACVALWLIAAAGIGWVIWRLLFHRDESLPTGGSLALVTCVALGIGIISFMVHAMALSGGLDQATAIALIALGCLVSAVLVAQRRKQWDVNPWLRARTTWGWLWLAMMPLLAMTFIAAFFPPGLLWGDEPNGYDVVEYHLQIPREWFEAHQMMPLYHNVFSYFPFNVEMNYLLAMHLRDGPWAGMYMAQLMHTAMCILCVVAVWAILGGGRRGAMGAIICAAVPWLSLLAPVAYNEGGTLLFGILAIGWAMRAQTVRQLALAGGLAGFAGGAKLSVLPVLVIGIPLALIALGRFSAPRWIGGSVIFGLSALLTLSPWLLQDYIWTGNPVFPEAVNLLGKGHFTDVQVKRWQLANETPDKNHRGIDGRLAALWEQVLGDWRYGFILFPLAVAAIVLSLRNRAAIYLLILLVTQTIFWLCFTHVQSRFMVIVIPIIALLIAQCDRRFWTPIGVLAAIFLIVWSSINIGQKLGKFLHSDRVLAEGLNGVGLIGRENLLIFHPDLEHLPEKMPLDLAGDAMAFEYQIPMSQLNYKTVFDVDTSDPRKTIEQDWLAGMPATPAVVANSEELERFARTYYGIPSPPTTENRK